MNPYQVTRGKIAEFARALGDSHPAFHEVAAAKALGYTDVVAPPTFPIVVSLGLLEGFLAAEQVPLRRVVHTAQSFEFQRPVLAGDELTGELTVSSRRAFGANEMVVTTSAIRTHGGELVAVADATVLITAEQDGETPAGLVHSTDDRVGVPVAAAEFSSVGTLSADAELGSATVAVGRTDLVRYAGASGDFNPIHFSQHAARSLGLPDVIAHGMFTMGLASRVVTAALDDPGRLQRLSTKFSNPVVVPDDGVGAAVTFAGTVTADDNGLAIALSATHAGTKVLNQAKALVQA